MTTVRVFICLLLGHRWGRIRDVCHRRSLFPGFEMAGTEATCQRCGYHWVDQCDTCRSTEVHQ